ncbi:hypothetical protein TRE132_40380 [Pseudomonas chlororaphis subsp. aurantiaca]|nr:hypothetical protein TRE132_40380 [Pseudomonas chlororaphis subsp. aurantiaca]
MKMKILLVSLLLTSSLSAVAACPVFGPSKDPCKGPVIGPSKCVCPYPGR